jgi:hypothetical protein
MLMHTGDTHTSAVPQPSTYFVYGRCKNEKFTVEDMEMAATRIINDSEGGAVLYLSQILECQPWLPPAWSQTQWCLH